MDKPLDFDFGSVSGASFEPLSAPDMEPPKRFELGDTPDFSNFGGFDQPYTPPSLLPTPAKPSPADQLKKLVGKRLGLNDARKDLFSRENLEAIGAYDDPVIAAEAVSVNNDIFSRFERISESLPYKTPAELSEYVQKIIGDMIDFSGAPPDRTMEIAEEYADKVFAPEPDQQTQRLQQGDFEEGDLYYTIGSLASALMGGGADGFHSAVAGAVAQAQTNRKERVEIERANNQLERAKNEFLMKAAMQVDQSMREDFMKQANMRINATVQMVMAGNNDLFNVFNSMQQIISQETQNALAQAKYEEAQVNAAAKETIRIWKDYPKEFDRAMRQGGGVAYMVAEDALQSGVQLLMELRSGPQTPLVQSAIQAIEGVVTRAESIVENFYQTYSGWVSGGAQTLADLGMNISKLQADGLSLRNALDRKYADKTRSVGLNKLLAEIDSIKMRDALVSQQIQNAILDRSKTGAQIAQINAATRDIASGMSVREALAKHKIEVDWQRIRQEDFDLIRRSAATAQDIRRSYFQMMEDATRLEGLRQTNPFLNAEAEVERLMNSYPQLYGDLGQVSQYFGGNPMMGNQFYMPQGYGPMYPQGSQWGQGVGPGNF